MLWVTAVRQSSQALEQLNAELEDRVAQRTAELALRNSELEARNAELDAFAHTVAHDLKNPLTGLIGFSTLLEKRCERMAPEKLRENLGNITQIGNKMTAIINELLLLSSIRRMDEVRRGPVDMGATIAEVRTRPSGAIAELDAEINLPSGWPTAIGYAPWIEEVWANYISNALKYGGQPARIELGFDELPNAQLRFWTLDNGPGVAPAIRNGSSLPSPAWIKPAPAAMAWGFRLSAESSKNSAARLESKTSPIRVPVSGSLSPKNIRR